MFCKVNKENFYKLYSHDEDYCRVDETLVRKVLLHETEHGEHFYLIEAPENRDTKIFVSDPNAPGVERLYESPDLPKDYSDGPYLWVEACTIQIIGVDSNQQAKHFLSLTE